MCIYCAKGIWWLAWLWPYWTVTTSKTHIIQAQYYHSTHAIEILSQYRRFRFLFCLHCFRLILVEMIFICVEMGARCSSTNSKQMTSLCICACKFALFLYDRPISSNVKDSHGDQMWELARKIHIHKSALSSFGINKATQIMNYLAGAIVVVVLHHIFGPILYSDQ